MPLDTWNTLSGLVGTISKGEPNRAAALFFHGLGQSGTCWTSPSSTGRQWDLNNDPTVASLGTRTRAGTGILDVVFSPLRPDAEIDRGAWIPRFIEQGFSVAEWTQPEGLFAGALASALTAFDQFLADTREIDPQNPPPVALIGHSRGGLLIREVLKQRGTLGRVKWVVTLQSPHKGSELARFPERFGTAWLDNIDLGFANGVRDAIKSGLASELSKLTAIVNSPAQRELEPDSALITSIENGEIALPGVRYLTFGGTRPTFTRVYVRVFTPDSAVPTSVTVTVNATGVTTSATYSWRVVPVEIHPASPVFDAVPDFTDELTPGLGDGLVADANSHLPFEEQHFSPPLNHAEILWDQVTSANVMEALHQQTLPVQMTLDPPAVTLTGGQSQRFTVQPSGHGEMEFSLDAQAGSPVAGFVTRNGTYHAPQSVYNAHFVTVRATSAGNPLLSATAIIGLLPNILRRKDALTVKVSTAVRQVRKNAAKGKKPKKKKAKTKKKAPASRARRKR